MEIYYRRAEGANKTRVRVQRNDEALAKPELDRQCYLLSVTLTYTICHYQGEKYDENLLSLNLALQIT